jgi:hypothetical protein
MPIRKDILPGRGIRRRISFSEAGRQELVEYKVFMSMGRGPLD